ncbi:MAG TPA: PAS domain-containing sensor histidine kinase [Syntrophorhabdaceae bacterium]|nr:PAS domain-containing sensor histidine kinase [Syntrophorhabdaceae bacterium]
MREERTTPDSPIGAAAETGSCIPGEPVAELKELEAHLKETEEKYKNIFENAMEGIFQTDREGYFTQANPSFARIHGYDSPKKILGVMHARELFVDPADHSRLIDLLFKSGSVRNYETQMLTRDKTVHWVSSNVMLFRDEKGRAASYEGTMLDITERKKVEQALLESEERYRTAIENSNDAIIILREDIYQYANKRLKEMFKYDPSEEIIGKSMKQTVHPDDLEMVTDIMGKRQRGEPVPSRYEFKGLTRTGEIIYVEVSAANITYRGSSVYLLYLRDITERKQAEAALMKSHKELEQLNKAKTKAVNHISHELKTPLSVIQGSIRLLKRKLMGTELSSSLTPIIDALERNTERLFSISWETDEIFNVSQEVEAGILLNELDRLFERMQNLAQAPEAIRTYWEALKEWTSKSLSGSMASFQPIEVYPSVSSIVEKIKGAAGHRSIRFNVAGPKHASIDMDPVILREVTEGIVKNAVENTPDGGVIDVTMEERDGCVLLHVKDYGVGITEENQKFLLDGLFHTKETELYSTKKPYDFGAGGKGLDLLRIKYYAQRYGFDISLESTRCIHIPTDSDLCPGDISNCKFCKTVDDCVEAGSTTFTVTFRAGKKTDPSDG